MKPKTTIQTHSFVNHLFADIHAKISKKTYPLGQYHKDIIQKQFSLCYGLKQLVQDGNKDALMALSQRTGFNPNFLISNLETLKTI